MSKKEEQLTDTDDREHTVVDRDLALLADHVRTVGPLDQRLVTNTAYSQPEDVHYEGIELLQQAVLRYRFLLYALTWVTSDGSVKFDHKNDAAYMPEDVQDCLIELHEELDRWIGETEDTVTKEAAESD